MAWHWTGNKLLHDSMMPYLSLSLDDLTHWGRDKMAITLADICKCNFINENILISIKNSLNFVPEGPIDNKSTWGQVMVWHQIGDKPLPEPMMTQFDDAYMRHLASMS